MTSYAYLPPALAVYSVREELTTLKLTPSGRHYFSLDWAVLCFFLGCSLWNDYMVGDQCTTASSTALGILVVDQVKEIQSAHLLVDAATC